MAQGYLESARSESRNSRDRDYSEYIDLQEYFRQKKNSFGRRPIIKNMLGSMLSKHNRFMFILMVLIMFLALLGTVLLIIFFFLAPGTITATIWPAIATIWAVLLAALLGASGVLYNVCQSRINTVSVFMSEIVSHCHIIHMGEMTPICIRMYYYPYLKKTVLRQGKEDYMAIFHSNSKDLGFLSGETVARITKFYTYLKTCRDLLGQIAEKQEQPNALVRLEFLFASYCFFACLENALYVTAELSEDEGEYKEYANYMLGSCTQAYVFLLYVLWEEREEKERKKSRRLEHLRHNLRLKNFTGTSGEDENDAVGKVIVDEGAFSRYLISIGRLAKMHQESDWVRKNSPPEFMEGMMRNIGMYIDSSVDYETRMMRFDCKAENEIQEKVYEFMKPTVFEGRPLVIKKNIQEYYNEFRKVIGRIEI